MTHWFFSPHPDDAALSCGGQIAMLTGRGERVIIVTAFSGDVPRGFVPSAFVTELHARWGFRGDAPRRRRAEDRAAAGALGARLESWRWPEAIYRTDAQGAALYPDVRAIFGDIHPEDRFALLGIEYSFVTILIERAARREIRPDDVLHFPLGVGHHVDHQILSLFARRLQRGQGAAAHMHPGWQKIALPGNFRFYEEYPYSRQGQAGAYKALAALQADLDRSEAVTHTIEPTALEAKIASIACHRSQLSSFWKDDAEMRAGIADDMRSVGGEREWQLIPQEI
jgi:LmbE family N-acetylglucosaminyl deacetylase